MGRPLDAEAVVAEIVADSKRKRLFQAVCDCGVDGADVGNALSDFERGWNFADARFSVACAATKTRFRRTRKRGANLQRLDRRRCGVRERSVSNGRVSSERKNRKTTRRQTKKSARSPASASLAFRARAFALRKKRPFRQRARSSGRRRQRAFREAGLCDFGGSVRGRLRFRRDVVRSGGAAWGASVRNGER